MKTMTQRTGAVVVVLLIKRSRGRRAEES
jgi:hypothetical protein